MTRGAVEEFIATFNSLEVEQNLFALRDSWGIQWWDLVRYRVQFALCVERGIYRTQPSAILATVSRAQSALRQTKQLFRDIALLRTRHAGQVRTLIVSTRRFSFLDDVETSEASQGRGALIANKGGEASAPHIAISKQSVEFFVRITRRGQRIPHDLTRDAQRVANEIRLCFASRMDIFGIILSKYRDECIARRAWSFILDRTDALERLVYINDDTVKSLVTLARARGITTEELQHAYMGRSHIAFSYPPLSVVLETLPDRVVVTRDTGDITYPVKRVVIATQATATRTGVRDIDVLIGASPTLRLETDLIVAALQGHGLKIAIKLHPTQTAQSLGLHSRFHSSDIAIHEGKEDFGSLARRSLIYVPANPTSTTTFEAAENGARLVVVDFGGVRKTSMNDSILSSHASLEALSEVIREEMSRCHRDPSIVLKTR
jgi:hypothetical protein